MKSIIEESSTIAKAIEKAWDRAGNPEEFSVKIFQDAEKNFFGFTKKKAKIGIFFSPQIKKTKPETTITEEQKNSTKKPAPVIHPDLCKQATLWIKSVLAQANLSHITFTVKMQKNTVLVTFSDHLKKVAAQEKKIFANMSYLLLCALRNKLNSDLKDTKILFKQGN